MDISGIRGVESRRGDVQSVNPEIGISRRRMVEDQMDCLCGETFRGEKGKGEIARQYWEHMKRLDHKGSPEQWFEAGKRIEEWKAKSRPQP